MIAMMEAEYQYASHLDKWCKEGVEYVENGLDNFLNRI
jgi:hypothetical protein